MSQRPVRIPLFVRVPQETAARLDAAAHRLGRSKQDVVAGLVDEHLADEVRLRVMTDEPLVGRIESWGAPPEVLTLEQVAELLQVAAPDVLERVDRGELPARRLGGEWRFSRQAVLV